MQLFANKTVMPRLYQLTVLLAGLGAVCVAPGTIAARPQDQGQAPSPAPSAGAGGGTQPTQPVPAIRSPLASLSDNEEDADQQIPATPDDHALAGAQYLTLGGPAYRHSYWQPEFDLSAAAFSSPELGGSGGWSTYTSLAGALNLTQISGNSTLTLSYDGGVSFSNDGGSTVNNDELAVTEALRYRRWRLDLIDQLSYLPQASFGYTTLGVTVPTTTGNTSGVQNGYLPDQSILTAAGQRISNASIFEVDYLLSPRATLTFVGSASTLNYFDNDLNNTVQGSGQVGYNYLLSRRDTIAVTYSFSAFRYENINQSINSHAVQLAYSRRQTGKLAFQISAGPEFTLSTIPLTSSSASTVATPTNTIQFEWTASLGLTYQLRQRTSLQATYSHGVTGGSGVLAGAVSDSAAGSLSHQLTKATTLGFSGGYSRNSGLALTPGLIETETETGASNQTYDYWYGGVGLTRRIGRSINLLLGYQLQYQNSNASFCVTTPCGSSYTTHDIYLDLQFRPKFIPF